MCGLLSVAKWLLFFLPPEDAISSVHHQMPTSSYSGPFYYTVMTRNGTWLANSCHVARLAAHFYNSYIQLSLDSQFIKVHRVVCVTKNKGWLSMTQRLYLFGVCIFSSFNPLTGHSPPCTTCKPDHWTNLAHLTVSCFEFHRFILNFGHQLLLFVDSYFHSSSS